MRMYSSLIVVAATAVVSVSSPSGSSVAQTSDASVIADNDSVYIDAKSFKIVPGKAKGGTSALIEALDARKLGPGAIVFRSGDELYIVDARPVILAQHENRYGSDRYGSDRDTSVSAAQADRDWQEYLAQTRRYGSDRYGSDRYGSDRYGTDRSGGDPSQQRIYINDPEYAQYKLKKFFADNWTSDDSK
jgi:hypothetical protein